MESKKITKKPQDILKDAKDAKNVTQKIMAESLGLKTPQAVGNILYRNNSVRVNTFVKLLNLMGYEVIVREIGIGEREEWTVDYND